MTHRRLACRFDRPLAHANVAVSNRGSGAAHRGGRKRTATRMLRVPKHGDRTIVFNTYQFVFAEVDEGYASSVNARRGLLFGIGQRYCHDYAIVADDRAMAIDVKLLKPRKKALPSALGISNGAV